jgi:hypothetical protein
MKGNSMISLWRLSIIRYVAAGLIFFPVMGLSADFELFWDSNCNTDPALEGYAINFRENGSVVSAPDEATTIFVGLTDNGFDPSDPSYQISDLQDDILYCFTVSAAYKDVDSSMSNEICGVNGLYTLNPNSAPTYNTSGGCFFNILK